MVNQNQTNEETYDLATEIVVRQTNQYNRFIGIDGNRVVNVQDVDIIKKSMAIKQLVVPVIVNELMQIIDGQHRVQACADLGLPIYYVILFGYRLEEVQRINAKMRAWSNKDFLDSYVERYNSGQEQYVQYNILNEFSINNDIPLSTALILSDLRKSKKAIIDSFKDGTFLFRREDIAQGIIDGARDFNQYDKKVWKKGNFIRVFASLFMNGRYNHETMMNNVPRKISLLAEMVTDHSTMTNLMKIYNLGTPRARKLYEDTVKDAWDDMINRED